MTSLFVKDLTVLVWFCSAWFILLCDKHAYSIFRVTEDNEGKASPAKLGLRKRYVLNTVDV